MRIRDVPYGLPFYEAELWTSTEISLSEVLLSPLTTLRQGQADSEFDFRCKMISDGRSSSFKPDLEGCRLSHMLLGHASGDSFRNGMQFRELRAAPHSFLILGSSTYVLDSRAQGSENATSHS